MENLNHIRIVWSIVIVCVILVISVLFVNPSAVICRDPDLGGHIPANMKSQRRFLLLGGAGAGIGNFLVFYPAAYYFAALTGRDILIMDGSLVAEMCDILTCGFPKYSELALAFPKLLGPDQFAKLRGAKAWDMGRHFSGEVAIEDTIVRADGYKYMSGWYFGYNGTQECVAKLTGCELDDVACHDRHALQRLVRGK